MMKRILKIAGTLFIIYLFLCGFLYLTQESLIFFPKKLPQSYQFQNKVKFEELRIPTADGISLHGLLFKADTSKGLIFYLHGNGGALDSWSSIASFYTQNQFDIFILDYRGYGKSEGEISSQKQFFSDIQTTYDFLSSRYSEDQIIVIGYSIGTGPATFLASQNKPKQLILKAPYYSLVDMMHHTYPFIPDLILKYKFETYKYIQDVDAPITIFHGNKDQVIYYGSSIKLKQHIKSTDQLITIKNWGHNGINNSQLYREVVSRVIND